MEFDAEAPYRNIVRQSLDSMEFGLRTALQPVMNDWFAGAIPNKYYNSSGDRLELSAMLEFLTDVQDSRKSKREGQGQQAPRGRKTDEPPFRSRNLWAYANTVRKTVRNDTFHSGRASRFKTMEGIRHMVVFLEELQQWERASELTKVHDALLHAGLRKPEAMPLSASAPTPASPAPDRRSESPQATGWSQLRASVNSTVSNLGLANVEESMKYGWIAEIKRPWAKAVNDYVRSGRPILKSSEPALEILEIYEYPESLREREMEVGIQIRLESGRFTSSFAVGEDEDCQLFPAVRYKVTIRRVTPILYVARYRLLNQAQNKEKLNEFVSAWMAEERSTNPLASTALFFSRDFERFVERQERKIVPLDVEAVRVYDDGDPKAVREEQSNRVATLIEAVPPPKWTISQFLSRFDF